MISIIIPTYNEEHHIYKLLKSISTYPSISEILIIDGMSSDDTRLKINEFISLNKRNDICIRILDNKKKLQGYALNIGIKSSINDQIVRIDAHSTIKDFVRKDYFEEIVKRLKTNKYSMIGFKQRFMFNSFFQASVYTLSFTNFLSKSLYRYTNKEISSFDTAWLFAINRKDAISVNFLNPKATPNEDYDFCQRLIRKKAKPILIYPQLPIYYLPRTNLLSLAKQYFKYGYSRAETNYRLKNLNGIYSLIFYLSFNLILLFLTILLFTLSIINIKIYLLILLILNICFWYQIFADKLAYTRNKSLSINLLIGILISPFLANIPIIFRTLGSTFYIFKKII